MSKKILLIEDERLIKEMYAQRLEDEGFKIFVAETTDQAEKILKKEKIDLIILDLLLPRENGFEYLKRTKNQKKPKIIVLTNLEGREYREITKEMGALDYFLKTDYTPSALIKLIKNFL
jgi:DNA-binding response OmpR family regulator